MMFYPYDSFGFHNQPSYYNSYEMHRMSALQKQREYERAASREYQRRRDAEHRWILEQRQARKLKQSARKKAELSEKQIHHIRRIHYLKAVKIQRWWRAKCAAAIAAQQDAAARTISRAFVDRRSRIVGSRILSSLRELNNIEVRIQELANRAKYLLSTPITAASAKEAHTLLEYLLQAQIATDGISTYGEDAVRGMRKAAVQHAQNEIDHLEIAQNNFEKFLHCGYRSFVHAEEQLLACK